jgi:hypothetical protein
MNEALKASQELVTAIRDLAREMLRAKWISNVLQNVMYNNSGIDSTNKSIESTNKSIAQTNYDISKLDPQDPSYQVKLDSKNNDLKFYNEYIVRDNKVLEDYAKANTNEFATITKIESGELKISAENLEVKAKELIEAYYSQNVVKVLD